MNSRLQRFLAWWQVQAQHIGWGFALCLALAPWLGWWSLPVVLDFAFFKEIIEHLWGVWEPRQSWSDTWADVGGFAWGIALAAAYFVGFTVYAMKAR